jgi:hypothetical protein
VAYEGGSRWPFGVRSPWLEEVAEHIRIHGIGRDELLFSTEVGTPISRNTFRTRVWLPAVKAPGIDFGVRMHDLRHAHAPWLLAGGADLKGVMDRMGHADPDHSEVSAHVARHRSKEPRRPDADRRFSQGVIGDRASLRDRERRRLRQQAEATRHNREGRSRGSTGCDRSSRMAGRLTRAARRPSIG